MATEPVTSLASLYHAPKACFWYYRDLPSFLHKSGGLELGPPAFMGSAITHLDTSQTSCVVVLMELLLLRSFLNTDIRAMQI